MKKIWTEERLNILKELCRIPLKTEFIAKRMDLSKRQVNDAMSYYGIHNGLSGKGKKPAKRKKPEIKKENPGCFQKGYIHPGTKPEGSITRTIARGKPSFRIKVNNKWISAPRYIYERDTGYKVPTGFVVHIIDEEKPITVSNLKIVALHRNFTKKPNNAKPKKKRRKSIKSEMYDPRQEIY